MLGHPVGLATYFPMCMAVCRFGRSTLCFKKKKTNSLRHYFCIHKQRQEAVYIHIVIMCST